MSLLTTLHRDALPEGVEDFDCCSKIIFDINFHSDYSNDLKGKTNKANFAIYSWKKVNKEYSYFARIQRQIFLLGVKIWFNFCKVTSRKWLFVGQNWERWTCFQMKNSSKIRWLLCYPFNAIQDGPFGAAHKGLPSLKSVTHNLQWWNVAVTPHLKKIQKLYESRDTPLEFCWCQHFLPKISNFFYIKKYCIDP